MWRGIKMIDFSTLARIKIAVFVVSVIPTYWLLISAFSEENEKSKTVFKIL
ncbi:MAG: hypothetical protein WBZ36_22655 [Candidatus Nitrosopolaris sp.]